MYTFCKPLHHTCVHARACAIVDVIKHRSRPHNRLAGNNKQRRTIGPRNIEISVRVTQPDYWVWLEVRSLRSPVITRCWTFCDVTLQYCRRYSRENAAVISGESPASERTMGGMKSGRAPPAMNLGAIGRSREF